MQTPSDHLTDAARNEEFASAIRTLPTRYPEWEVTVLFYCALHYLDAYLATQGHYPENHFQRNRLVRSVSNVSTEYLYLFQQSIDARYESARFTPEQVDQLLTGPFLRVKEEMLSLLGT